MYRVFQEPVKLRSWKMLRFFSQRRVANEINEVNPFLILRDFRGSLLPNYGVEQE